MSTAGRLAGLALACLAASPLAAQSRAADSTAIQEAARRFSAAYVRGDAETMAGLYTADAVIFPDRSEAITGSDAIRRYWTLRPGRRITRHEIVPTAVTIDGMHAYDHGIYEVSGENDGTAWGPSRGKYVVVWRREPAGWRMQLDIWNSLPPAAP